VGHGAGRDFIKGALEATGVLQINPCREEAAQVRGEEAALVARHKGARLLRDVAPAPAAALGSYAGLMAGVQSE
jgi:hypothetical protein